MRSVLKSFSCCLEFFKLLFLLLDQLHSLLTSARLLIQQSIAWLQLMPARRKLLHVLLVVLQTRFHVCLHHSQLQQQKQRIETILK